MLWVRSQLARIGGGWLVLHLCLLASIPATLCATTPAGAIAADCTCEHGDGQMCPMHHSRSTSKPAPDSDTCSCRGTSDPLARMAASLTGPPAVLTPASVVVVPADTTAWLPEFGPAPLESSFVPDSPPPRR